MAIDPNLPIPVYFQLKTLLLEEILEGRTGRTGGSPPSTSSAGSKAGEAATSIPPSRACSPPGPSWWWPRPRPAGSA